jgi:hypothetical protein
VHAEDDVSGQRTNVQDVDCAADLEQIHAGIGARHEAARSGRELLDLQSVVRSLTDPGAEELDRVTRRAYRAARGFGNEIQVAALDVGLRIGRCFQNRALLRNQDDVVDTRENPVDVEIPIDLGHVDAVARKNDDRARRLVR